MPVPKDEIVVPAVIPVPLIAIPTVNAPEVTAVTVRTVVATEPVTTAVDAAPINVKSVSPNVTISY